jgi:hypothetical protein
MGLMGYRSDTMPNGRLERAIPKMTAEMLKEAMVSSTPNSI